MLIPISWFPVFERHEGLDLRKQFQHQRLHLEFEYHLPYAEDYLLTRT